MLILRRHRAHRFAVAALAAALAIFSAPLASLLHEASVRHIACLEHGEMVDAPAFTAAELAAPQHHHARTVLEKSNGAPSNEEDAHCLIAAGAHQRSTPAHAGEALLAPLPTRAPAIAAIPDRRAPAIALFRLAPKSSPPQA